MTRVSADNPILKNISIARFVEYLKQSGWMLLEHPNERILLFEGSVDDNGSPLQLILPRSNHFQDATILLAEALNLLTVITRESLDVIIDRIQENRMGERKLHKSGDTIKFKMFVELLDVNENHVPILEKAFEREPDDKYTFKGWYQSHEGRFFRHLIKFLFLLSCIYIVGSFLADSYGWKKVLGIFYAAEAGILILVALDIFPKFQLTKIGNPALQAASSSTRMVLRSWAWLWISWFSLYSVLAIAEFTDWRNKIPFLLNACNNLSGIFLFSMYYEMTERTASNPSFKRRKLFLLATMFLLSLFVLELGLWIYLNANAEIVFSFISGIIIGVATGLLVTALASKIINLPSWAVIILTLYAVIQLAFPVLAHQEGGYQKILPFILVAALLGKVFLLAIVHWARDTNRLLYYMARTRRIYDEENEQSYAQSFNDAVFELEKVAHKQ